jgi:predicted acylesterase/phospholipase RssA/CRP-like cAMP-binding protein
LYLIISGKLNVFQPKNLKTPINELGPGEYAGELAVLTGQPCTTTVIAAAEMDVRKLSKTDFDQLAKIHPYLITRLMGELLSNFRKTRANFILTRVFGQIAPETLADLCRELEWRRLEAGQVLCRQGEPGEELFIVVQGRLRFTVETAGEKRDLGEVGAGESVGEFALLAEQGAPESLRSATVTATRPSEVVVITRSVFEKLLRTHPQILLGLTRRIIRRELQITQPAAHRVSALVITVLPAHPDLDLGEFSRQMAESLDGLGSTLLWDPAHFDELYGKPGASQTPLAHPTSAMLNAWLDDYAQQVQYVVYTVPQPLDGVERLTPWALRCVEAADIILMVGDDGTNPAPTAIEAGLAGARAHAHLELALLHPGDCQVPSGTLNWLAPRRARALALRAHHHLRLGNSADFRRLARRLSGKPVGLTLGGGGARGWAHIGVIRALEEAGMEADLVGGASMGAIIAAGYALGWPVERLNQLAVLFSNPKKLLDYTLPYASITSTGRISALLQELCGEAQIEDAWRPFFCVSANLTRGEEQLHTSGLVWKTVRASMAFPGIFAPVLDDGCVLIDGGAANNVPVDRMRELCPTGTVIGVDLNTSSPMNGKYNFGSSLSGWQVLLSRLNPFTNTIKAPNLIDIVSGLVYSNNRYRLNEVWRSADLLIRVPVEEYGLLDFDKYVQIIETGYKSTQEQIKNFEFH